MPLLTTWSLRRVLLAGEPCPMLRQMRSQLCSLGARPLLMHDALSGESLCRALHEGRYACLIVPDMMHLHDNPNRRIDALNTLLCEAREAGVPLAMLLGSASDNEAALLFSHALGWAQGVCGDPVSIQCIRHRNREAHAVCRDALLLGARFFAGETSCTGSFCI